MLIGDAPKRRRDPLFVEVNHHDERELAWRTPPSFAQAENVAYGSSLTGILSRVTFARSVRLPGILSPRRPLRRHEKERVEPALALQPE